MNRPTIDRREVIKKGLAWSLGVATGGGLLSLSSCDPETRLPPCPWAVNPLEWAPNVVQPVSYGYADYNPGSGAPTNLRVYYPSPDLSSPSCAAFLSGPGHFPLVIFLHGHCSENLHYTKWSHLPQVLARSGFIVAIPDLGENSHSPWDLNNPNYELINRVITWMRSSWSQQQFLMPTLGIVGHSYGALLGGQLAKTIPATAYVSLGGTWTEWPPFALAPINSLNVPKLLVWGTGFTEAISMLPAGNWNALSQPKYRLVFAAGEHWDYVPSSQTSCTKLVGPCNGVHAVSADFIALFLSKYMPPDTAPWLLTAINPDLIPPSVTLTPKQKPFAVGHLTSFALFSSHTTCGATLTWATPFGSGSRSLP